MTECVNRLIAKPPQSRHEALTLFSYFSSRLAEIGQNNVAKLADGRIVPVMTERKMLAGLANEKTESQVEVRHLTPRQCYLGKSPKYAEIFDFVDFDDDANAFLLKCGSKTEPTTLELATLVCKEPARLLGILQSPEKYLEILRSLADELPILKRDKALFKQMKASKCLLGSVDIPGNSGSKNSPGMDGNESDEDFDSSIKQYQLAIPSQIVIVSSIFQNRGREFKLFRGVFFYNQILNHSRI
jgi:hypothetical protein